MSLPPGPTSPTFVQTLHWLRRPYEFLEECAARYGDVFRFGLTGVGTAVVVSRPEHIKEIFAQGPDALVAGKANAVVKPFVGENSLLVLDGPEHHRQRKLLMPAFHGERMQAYGQAMLDLAAAAIKNWPLNETFSLHPQMQDVTLRVILRTIFGVAEGAQFERLCQLTRTTVEIASNPLLLFPFMQLDLGAWSPWGKFLRLRAKIDDILRDEIARRRSTGSTAGQADALAMLLEARDDQGEPMTFQELRDELVTMLVAGHETTANALAWTLYFLLRDTALRERLTAEIRASEDAGRLVPERVARIELLDATIREGLRIRPVAPVVGRFTVRPFTIAGYELPAGVMLAPAVHLAHRRAPAFPDPDRFDPERFLRARPSPSEWLPFGGGNRRCIGAAFATYEMKMVLAQLLTRASLEVAPDYKLRTVRRGITLAPAEGVRVLLRART